MFQSMVLVKELTSDFVNVIAIKCKHCQMLFSKQNDCFKHLQDFHCSKAHPKIKKEIQKLLTDSYTQTQTINKFLQKNAETQFEKILLDAECQIGSQTLFEDAENQTINILQINAGTQFEKILSEKDAESQTGRIQFENAEIQTSIQSCLETSDQTDFEVEDEVEEQPSKNTSISNSVEASASASSSINERSMSSISSESPKTPNSSKTSGTPGTGSSSASSSFSSSNSNKRKKYNTRLNEYKSQLKKVKRIKNRKIEEEIEYFERTSERSPSNYACFYTGCDFKSKVKSTYVRHVKIHEK